MPYYRKSNPKDPYPKLVTVDRYAWPPTPRRVVSPTTLVEELQQFNNVMLLIVVTQPPANSSIHVTMDGTKTEEAAESRT